jgi:oligoendopeptidase F
MKFFLLNTKIKKMVTLLKAFIVFAIIQFLYLPLKAQLNTFEPFPLKNESEYHIDFKIFFENDSAEKADLQKFYDGLDIFYSLKNKTVLNSKILLASLQLYDSLLIQFNRHYIYHNLLSYVNRNNYVSYDLCNKIYADFLTKTSFFEKEVSGLSPEKIEMYLKEEPWIKKFSYFFEDILRNKEHKLDSSIEDKIFNLIPSISGWQFDLYSAITDNIKFEDIETPYGRLNVRRDRIAIQGSSDSSVRKAGFKKLYAGFNSMRDLYAFTIIKLANGINEESLLHNFKDAEDFYYFDKFHTKESVNTILKNITDSVNIYKHYQQIRADYKKRILSSNNISYWDMGFNNDFVPPVYSIDSANQIILSALSPLGNDYHKELSDLLNPLNRRMEIAPAENKRSGNFSRGFIGSTSIFFTGAYRGSYNDLRVLTHESTHAVHRQLMNINGVLPVYASGPSYFFESFAIFSEFLLSDYLIEHSKTNAEKQFFLELYFDNKGMALFSVAGDALLEQKIHEGVRNNIINSAKDLDSLNELINTSFSIWNTKEYPELNQRWITAGLFYEDPFYEINYVLGSMLALKYYQLYKFDKESFSKKYIALLKNGFNQPPQKLLKTFLDIDINDNNILFDDFFVTKIKVNQLEALYKSE